MESQANFIFVRVGDGDAAMNALMREGVIVRPGSAFGHPEWIRVTVGLETENERFLLKLRDFLACVSRQHKMECDSQHRERE